MIPLATYRLQFHKDFPFAAAEPLAGYLAALGVSHVYASPIATARAGSIHGYDVVDPTTINPELGGEAGFARLAEVLRRRNIGIILDIVPNHMAVGRADNRWWLDVLENGEASPHAGLFDIDWRGPDPALHGKVLAPFLGAPYAETLARGDIRLAHDDGAFAAIAHGVHRFPIRRDDHGDLQRDGLAAYDPSAPEGRARLHALLERQNFRLAWWRTAGDAINWRRFFDITELAGLRMETPAAFDLVHALPLRLYAEGLIDGLRVDHVDGLASPADYCRKLRGRLDAARPGERAWLIVEKILARGEPLAPDWGIDGTTGYDFMNEISLLQHDPAGGPALAAYWSEISGRSAEFAPEELQARTEMLGRNFRGQLAAAVDAFHQLAMASIETRDITRGALERVLTALAVTFPVYRTYATREGFPGWDSPILARSMARARPLLSQGEASLLDQVDRWIEGEGEPDLRAAAVRRWQQLTSPLAAKAVEDTAFYRYGRLISRNDVGFDAAVVGVPADEIHTAFSRRATHHPRSMLATATHDHKRGEDARARLAVLSEAPDLWIEKSRRWFEMNRRFGVAIDPADEAMLYQTLVGAWPMTLAPGGAGIAELRERVAAWQEKALREAKLRSSWAAPDAAYEARCRQFLEAVTDVAEAADFLVDLQALVDAIAPAAVANSFAQSLIRCTAPGAPDLFQGCEFWDFSLVDPDNRRPVDYAAREAALQSKADVAEGLVDWRSGAAKQALIARALATRGRLEGVFACGGYEPVAVEGAKQASVFAFVRESGSAAAIVAVTIRAGAALIGAERPTPAAAWWEETRLIPPERLAHLNWTDSLREARPVQTQSLLVRDLFADAPVALLVAS